MCRRLYQMQAVVAAEIADFVKFPPRQKPASFNLDAVLAQVTQPTAKSRASRTPEATGRRQVRAPLRLACPAREPPCMTPFFLVF